MLTVKDLKEILNEYDDNDIFCVSDLETSCRYLPNKIDIADEITGYFEVCIDDDNNEG